MEEKNILLVYPKFPGETYWGFKYALSFVGKKATMPPLGLITIAAMLPEKYNTRLVDMNVDQLKDEDMEWADIIFTSSMTVQKDSLEEVIARSKGFSKPVVAGGPYPTQYYDRIEGVDHFILGEAESGVLSSFLEDLEKGEEKKAYARQVIRKIPGEAKIDQGELENMVRFFGKGADIITAAARPDMMSSSVPRFDLLDMDAYSSMAMQLSRGCPHSCEFCSESALFGHMPRLKSAGQIVKELEAVHNLGFQGTVFMVDDNFIGNRKKVKDILPKIIEFQKKNDYHLSLYTEADISLSQDEELMGLMRDAGFNMVFVGLESPDRDVLRSMGKNLNVKINLSEGVKKIQKYGMEVTAGFIVGNDNDPDNIYDRIHDFCRDEGIPIAMVGLLNAVKGSPLYEILKKEGRLRKDTQGNNTHDFSFNFDPAKDEDKVIADYKSLLKRLYDADGSNYFERCSKLLDRLGYNPKPARSVGYTEVKASFLSFTKQTFSRYGKNYLKFISHSIKDHPELFPEAVRLAIFGNHFNKITNNSLEADDLKQYFAERSSYYMDKLEDMLDKKIAEGNSALKQLQKETGKFLANSKKNIKKLPDDYKDVLMEKYRSLVQSINNAFQENGYAFSYAF